MFSLANNEKYDNGYYLRMQKYVNIMILFTKCSPNTKPMDPQGKVLQNKILVWL